MSQYALDQLLDKMASLMYWKSVKAVWRDEANNPYAPGWYLELRGCCFHFDLNYYIVGDDRAVRDHYADEVSANALNRYGKLKLTLRDDPSIQRTRRATKGTEPTQNYTSDDTQDYYEVRLAGSGWGPGCRRF